MRALCLSLALWAPLAVAQPAAPAGRPAASGFVSDGGRLIHFNVVRDSVVTFGQGAEGRPRVSIPYAAFVDVLGRAGRAGALGTADAVAGPLSIDVDDRSVVRLATSVPVGALALALMSMGLIVLAGGAVAWERRARRASRMRAEFRRRLAAAREAERAHLARELHDGPVQDLCAVQLALGALDDGPSRTAVTGVVDELRALCDELRPSALDAFGLTAALAALADRADRLGWGGDGGGLAVRFSATDAVRAVADSRALGDERRLALYRIAQEALNNAVAHAGGTLVEVELDLDDDRIILTIDDDGTGPPAASALDYAADGHYGLLGMRERAELLRADLTIGPSPLGGTRVALAAPVPMHRLATVVASV
ncbi:sensor histidine kinase [Rubrivirga sp. IMCC43871]|uniref:sensor histidine kinase n=1 Tax=Rubrivirga sp. IMCC43871 TaxID=3391575 RepID=UPI00399002C7